MKRTHLVKTAALGILILGAAPLHAQDYGGTFIFDLDATLNSGTDNGFRGLKTTWTYTVDTVTGSIGGPDGGGAYETWEPILTEIEIEFDTSTGPTMFTWNEIQAPPAIYQGLTWGTVTLANSAPPTNTYPADGINIDIRDLVGTINGTDWGAALYLAGLFEGPNELTGTTVPNYPDWPELDRGPAGTGVVGIASQVVFYTLFPDGTGDPIVPDGPVYDLSGDVSHTTFAIPEPASMIGLPIIAGLIALRRRKR